MKRAVRWVLDTITVTRQDGPQDWTGWTHDDAPGLAIVAMRSIEREKKGKTYSLTHRATGRVVMWAEALAGAKECALELAPVADWTRAELTEDDKTRARAALPSLNARFAGPQGVPITEDAPESIPCRPGLRHEWKHSGARIGAARERKHYCQNCGEWITVTSSAYNPAATPGALHRLDAGDRARLAARPITLRTPAEPSTFGYDSHGGFRRSGTKAPRTLSAETLDAFAFIVEQEQPAQPAQVAA